MENEKIKYLEMLQNIITCMASNSFDIENNLHWVRDEAFREDRRRVRSENSPQIMAALRNLLVGLACKLRSSTSDMFSEFARFHKRAIKMIMEN